MTRKRKQYPAPRDAWVVMPDAYGPAESLERHGYTVAEVRAAWSKRFQRIKKAKCQRDIVMIHAADVHAARLAPNAKISGPMAVPRGAEQDRGGQLEVNRAERKELSGGENT
jgi:hypothetical protein